MGRPLVCRASLIWLEFLRSNQLIVFTILTAGWMQAEYRACQLMPWVLMRRSPTPASQSIFLDYLSKMNVVSLYQSLKQRHFLVSFCVAGSLILNGITVFSTGLFELDSVLITRPLNLTVPHKFGGANYDPYANDAKSFAACMAFSGRNMTRPVGIYENYVYTPFQPTSLYLMGNDTIPADRNYKADLEVIETSLDCQNATVSYEPYSDRWSNTTTPVYKTPDGCRYQLTEEAPLPMRQSEVDIGIEVVLRGCQGQRFNDSLTQGSPPYSNNWNADWRVWASIAPSVTIDMSAKDRLNYTGWDQHPIHVVVCKPRYTTYQGPVRIWREAGDNAVSADVQRQRLDVTEGISGIQATKLMYSGFQSASQSIYSLTTGSEFTFAANGTSRDVFWADNTVFTDAIAGSFSCLMQQMVKNKLLQDDSHYVEGTEQFIEGRLFVRQMSFWLMAVLLVMLIALVVVLLCLFVPVTACPRDTGSIGGVATILSQSPEFMDAFHGSQFKSEEQMAESRLGQTQYSTLSDMKGAFMLLPQDQSIPQSVESSEDSSPAWWQPFSSTWFIRITVVVVPIAVIIGLEVVYHLSTSGRGITLVDGKSPYIHYIWVYIPALVMFIIRCLFTSVEFGTRIMQPYSRLREGLAPPETSILENQLRKISPYALYDTIRKKQWALSAATMSLLLAAINPILVSGLFTAKASGPTSPMNLTQTTRWNLGDPAPVSGVMRYWKPQNFDSDYTTGLILNLNLSEPQWTHNNLAFPQVALTSTENPLPDKGFIEARIPALRSQFTCAPDPANGGCEVRRGRLWCELDSPCFVPISGDGNVNEIDYFLTYPNSVSSTLPSNCSTHAMLYGKKGENGTSTDYHYIYCNATLEEVEVDTKLQLPSLLIDLDTPPRVVEGSARTPFATNDRSFPSFQEMTNYLFQTDPSYNDAFLETISKGIGGVPLSELLDPEILIDRVSTVWGVLMAQLLNTGARDSFSSPFNATYFVEPATMEAPIYTGVFHDGRKYLVQNEISTRLLDGVLGSMVVCALIALCVMHTKRIIPKSPTSIASVASFLYGSRILGSGIPSGSEWCPDEELKKRGVFQGHSFSMGWWEVEKHRNRSGSSASSNSSISEDETQGRGGFGRGQNSLSEQDGKRGTRFGIDVELADRPLLRNPSV
jgi:hypothetical protein